MIENTLENKEKFFALYFKQRVLRIFQYPSIEIEVNSDTIFNRVYNNICYLELKPLESISDEDAAQCWVNDNYIPKSEDIKFVANLFNPITAINADYLRSKGYAISWMDLTVQDLIDYGWIKLVE